MSGLNTAALLASLTNGSGSGSGPTPATVTSLRVPTDANTVHTQDYAQLYYPAVTLDGSSVEIMARPLCGYRFPAVGDRVLVSKIGTILYVVGITLKVSNSNPCDYIETGILDTTAPSTTIKTITYSNAGTIRGPFGNGTRLMATTGLWTCPITGLYQVNTSGSTTGITAANAATNSRLVTTFGVNGTGTNLLRDEDDTSTSVVGWSQNISGEIWLTQGTVYGFSLFGSGGFATTSWSNYGFTISLEQVDPTIFGSSAS